MSKPEIETGLPEELINLIPWRLVTLLRRGGWIQLFVLIHVPHTPVFISKHDATIAVNSLKNTEEEWKRVRIR